MGNRAVITASKAYSVKDSADVGIYLHWNGGRDSVEAFLTYCKLRGFRAPDSDNYGWAYLCTVIGNFFGDGLSLGIDKCCRLDCENGDNGVYVIKGWEIVDRLYHDGSPEQRHHDLVDMVCAIDAAQPVKAQLGEAKIKEQLLGPGWDEKEAQQHETH